MSSSTVSTLQNASYNSKQPLHYFTGKIRSFWKNLVFFSDPKNVAFVEVSDVYFNGKHASHNDLAHLNDMVQSNLMGGPELHSYVSNYHGEISCPWQHEISGKMLWKARCAWFGLIPYRLKNELQTDKVYMPISYYTGNIVQVYNDKIIFGDFRNTVIVSLDNFYGRKDFNRGMYRNSSWHCNNVMHAYIIRLDVLSDNRLIGPEPHFPTWPDEHYSSDMWVAKFAWQGEMPEIVKDQVERFYILRMNQWCDIDGVPWTFEGSEEDDINWNSSDEEYLEYLCQLQAGCFRPFFPIEQKPGLMKGSLLTADENEGLMTSFVDVIAFNKENFYVNGKKFILSFDLSYFFRDCMIPLTAWVIPLDKPKVLFNIQVVWQAVCVWFRAPPRDLEMITSKYDCAKIRKTSLKTAAPGSLIHFIGKVESLSHASGVLCSRAGVGQQIKISFKRKAVYMHGTRFHTSCSLLDQQQLLESCVWSVLASPVGTDKSMNFLHYQALAMWHYGDQHYMNNIFKTVSDFVDLATTPQNTMHEELKDHTKEIFLKNFSGWIARVTEHDGIIQSGSAMADATYLYFRRGVLYMHGELLPESVSLHFLKQGRQCSVQAKPMPPQNIAGFQVTMEATLVWIGRKPSLESSGEVTPQSSAGSPSHVHNTKSAVDAKSPPTNTKTETCIWLENILHTGEGMMAGDILMADEQQGLIICSDIIVAFSSDVFYINGNKFKDKYNSLKDFCSDQKIAVQAVIIPLREPKVLLNCFVMCEAICVWSGLNKPNDLAVLQCTNSHKKQCQDINTCEISDKSFLYFLGYIIPDTKNVMLLACKTPGKTAKIILSKEKIFVDGFAVNEDDVIEQLKRKSPQNWCCVLAVSIPPIGMSGHSVKYRAIAAWDRSEHHKVRTQLLSATSSNNNDKKMCAEPKIACIKDKANGVADYWTKDITEALAHTLNLGNQKKEVKSGQQSVCSHLTDPSVIVSLMAKSSSEMESGHNFKVGCSASEQDFCGKHIGANIIKKTEKGGIAQWKSIQLKGFVFIEFSKETLYIDMKPINNDWELADVESRSCNLFAIPVPHHKVEDCIVSLKATCAWIGKKPAHFPSPGNQLLPKIDLTSVHVAQTIETQDTNNVVHDHREHDMEVPRITYQNNTRLSTKATLAASLKSKFLQSLTLATGQVEANITHKTLNGQHIKVNGSTVSEAPPVVPHIKGVIETKLEDIRKSKSKQKDHRSGTIVEVHATMGRLKEADGTLHYFSPDICYLFGVCLHNVELWHVLAQDTPVQYSVMESVPGIVKIQRVWIGSFERESDEEAAVHILAWCHEKLVPDVARDILVSQLQN